MAALGAGEKILDVAVPRRAGEQQLALRQVEHRPGLEQVVHALAHAHLAGEEQAEGPRRRVGRGRAEAVDIDAERHQDDAPRCHAVIDQRLEREARLRHDIVAGRKLGEQLRRRLRRAGPGLAEPAIFGGDQRQGRGRQRRFDQADQAQPPCRAQAAPAGFLEAVEQPGLARLDVAGEPARRETVVQRIARAIAQPAIGELRQRAGHHRHRIVEAGQPPPVQPGGEALPAGGGQCCQQREGQPVGPIIDAGEEIDRDAAFLGPERHAIHVALLGRVADHGAEGGAHGVITAR